MVESPGSSKPRDALLEKLRERIKERDRALEVKHKRIQSRSFNRQETHVGFCRNNK